MRVNVGGTSGAEWAVKLGLYRFLVSLQFGT